MSQPKRLREDDAVPEARDREELGDALEQPEDDRLEVADRRGEDHVPGAGLRSLSSRSGTRRRPGARRRAGTPRGHASRGGGPSLPRGPGSRTGATPPARPSRRSRSRQGDAEHDRNRDHCRMSCVHQTSSVGNVGARRPFHGPPAQKRTPKAVPPSQPSGECDALVIFPPPHGENRLRLFSTSVETFRARPFTMRSCH